jgi:para-nitrobenzyl esterase
LLAGFPFAPELGHSPLPDADAVEARIAAIAPHVDLLAGYTRDDGAPFMVMAQVASGQPLASAHEGFAGHTSETLTDNVFGEPTRRLCDTWTRHGGRAVTYRVDWSPPGAPLGACHCIELPLLFDTDAWSDAPMLGSGVSGSRSPAADMRSAWAAFARHGAAGISDRAMVFG